MKIIGVLMCIAFLTPGVIAAEDITISKSGPPKVGIDVAGFQSGSTDKEKAFNSTLLHDLERWGWFRLRKESAIRLTGNCRAEGGSLHVTASVVNKFDGKSYMQRNYSEKISSARKLAHRVADDIVFAVKGSHGIAATRIALIGEVNGRKDLYICDADGQRLVKMTRDGVPCLSPAWNPDASRIYYTSFHKGFPDVYAIDIAANNRLQVSSQPGFNAGPSISPDGNHMALTLSRDGNPELYVMNVKSGRLQRLTKTRQAAEASPSWSPDGKQIVYVSDKSGSPQLYIVSRSGTSPRSLTGRRRGESVSPDWGPDGYIVYSGRRDGNYQIVVLDPKTGRETQLTTGGGDHEEPSWAPDGRHIVYVKTVGYRMVLYILDTLGDPEIRLTASEGDWYSPSWSPR